MRVSHFPPGNRSAKSSFANLFGATLATLLVFPASLSAQRAKSVGDLQNALFIKNVMKNGRLYDASNLDEVYPRKVKGAPFPWNEDESPTRDELTPPSQR